MNKNRLKDLKKNLSAKSIEYISQAKEIDPFEADQRRDAVLLILAEIVSTSKARRRRSHGSAERIPHAA